MCVWDFSLVLPPLKSHRYTADLACALLRFIVFYLVLTSFESTSVRWGLLAESEREGTLRGGFITKLRVCVLFRGADCSMLGLERGVLGFKGGCATSRARCPSLIPESEKQAVGNDVPPSTT